MNGKNKFKIGDRVLWKHESGEVFSVTLTSSPQSSAERVFIELDDCPQTLLHGQVGKTQIVLQEELIFKENLQSILERARSDRLYASKFLEGVLESQGVPLTDKQRVIAWAAIEHILLKERLKLT